jgi:hypothetical protein
MLINTTQSSATFFRLYDGVTGFRADSTNSATSRFQFKVNPTGQANTINGTLPSSTWLWASFTVDDHETDPLLMRLRIFLQDLDGNFVSSGTDTVAKTNLGNLETLYIGSNELTTRRNDTLWGFFGLWDRVLNEVEMTNVIINSGRTL